MGRQTALAGQNAPLAVNALLALALLLSAAGMFLLAAAPGFHGNAPLYS